MPNPIDTLVYVHDAILSEAAAIEEAASAATPADVAALRERIAFFSRFVDLHTRGEEKGLFPKLVERQDQMAVTYLHDHEQERVLFSELDELCDACAKDDAAALARLRRQTIALHEHARAHIAKENEIIIPLVRELFSPPEQGAIVGDIVSVFSPEDMAAGVPFVVSRASLDNAASYVMAISAAMPPPVFEKAKGWIKEGVDADRVDALQKKVPVLA